MTKQKNIYIYLSIILIISFNNISCDEKYKQPSNQSQTIEKIDEEKNLLGKVLAGLVKPQEKITLEVYQNIVKTNAYFNHYNEMQKAWKQAEDIRLKKMRDWTQVELAHFCNKDHTLFYPFSGPDMLNAQILFPCAKEYILFGLEPPGYLRDITTYNEKDLNRYLYFIRDSLKSILNYSFFRTNDMKVDFFQKLDGVAPIILTFLVYNESQIIRITPVTLLSDGIVENSSDKGIKGIRFYFKNHSEKIRTITYYQVDISNENLNQHPYFLEVLQKKSPFVTFLKAASYLMYRDSFSKIREFILANSHYVIQDDSGMPLKSFDRSIWHLTFYGTYTKPIPLFASRFQADLKNIYDKKENVKPLPFGTGYQFYPGTSNLMIAEKILNKTN